MTKEKSSSRDASLGNQSLKNNLNQIRKDIKRLRYDESMAELDILLSKLQHDAVPVEELKDCYLQAKIHIEHCDDLLKNIEQEVIELNTDELASDLEG